MVGDESLHLRKRFDKGLGHFSPLELTRAEHESADLG